MHYKASEYFYNHKTNSTLQYQIERNAHKQGNRFETQECASSLLSEYKIHLIWLFLFNNLDN